MNYPNDPPEPTFVTITGMQRKIKRVNYVVIPETTTTLCLMEMHNGFVVIGQSGCVDKKMFNTALGEKYAYDKAIDKLWELEGYLLAEKLNGEDNAS